MLVGRTIELKRLKDDAMTICEIKYTDKPFTIDKSYAENLKRKLNTFVKKTETKKQIFLSIISANGIKATSYFRELGCNVITLNVLFKY